MQEKSFDSAEFLARLELAMRMQGLRDVDLFREHGIAQSTVSRWRSGSAPRTATLNALADALRVRREWLRTGAGAMEEYSSVRESFDSDQPRRNQPSDGVLLDRLLEVIEPAKIKELILKDCETITRSAEAGQRPNDNIMDALRTLWEALADRAKTS